MLSSKLNRCFLFASTSRLCFTTAFSGSGLTSEQFMKKPQNEPVLEYKKGSEERIALEKCLTEYSTKCHDIPLRIGGEKIFNNLEKKQLMPSDHKTVIARYTYAKEAQIRNAIKASLAARDAWHRMPLKKRADIMLHAADLCAGKYRMALNATTMLGQGKNIVQAEIDSACELTDFLRFNSMFALELLKYNPICTSGIKNTMHYRALEGFVAAISPFNFTAIGGNLCSAPALMGNAVLWKPSDTAVLSNYIFYEILLEAGVPPGLISFLPADGPAFGKEITQNQHLAAINFTGSLPTFRFLWKKVGEHLTHYSTFPRLIGECGGKNFHFVHPSANVESVVNGTIRAGFEYQGQKCSACSRLFVPESLWDKIKNGMTDIAKKIKVGDVRDGSIFMSAVIDRKAFARITSYIKHAERGVDGAKIIFGGKYDSSKGYFIQPTLIQVDNWKSTLLTEEIFGPVITAIVYPDRRAMETVKKLKRSSVYGLTGSIYSEDKDFLYKAKDELWDAVGNMYLNDKSTGSIVGQQPFGGARLSGTNDKAGGPHYMLRWSSQLCVKESSIGLNNWRYPSMD